MKVLFSEYGVTVDERYLNIGSTSIALDKVESVSYHAEYHPNTEKTLKIAKWSGGFTLLFALILLSNISDFEKWSQIVFPLIATLIAASVFKHYFSKYKSLPDVGVVTIATAMRKYEAYRSTDSEAVEEFSVSLRAAIELAKRGLTITNSAQQIA